MLTRSEFEDLMDQIDRELNRDGYLFHQRPMHAFSRLIRKIDPKGSFPISRSTSLDIDDFSNTALFDQVHTWYEEKYGDRIKIHMGPGSYVLVIKDEPWKVDFPLIFGQISFTIDSDLSKKDRHVIGSTGKKIPSVNILSHVENMTVKVASSLSASECESILREYMFALNAVQHMRDLKAAPYMEQAVNDYDMAVKNLFYKYPDYNNSKWSSLQFAEKTLKSKLESNGIPFKRNHNLADLSKKLEALVPTVPRKILDNIQCSAGVRYGEERVVKHEAISALQSALALYSQVFEASAFAMNES